MRVRESADRPHVRNDALSNRADLDATVQSADLQSAGRRSEDSVQPSHVHLHHVQVSIANASSCVIGSSQEPLR